MKLALEASGAPEAPEENPPALRVAPPPVGRDRFTVLAVVTAVFTLNAVAVLAVAPLTPLLRDTLGLTRGQVGLFISSVYLGGVMMSVPAGWLVERLGVRATLSCGLVLTAIMVTLAAWSPGFPAMLAFLLVGGFGFAVVNPATGKVIVERFPARERGLAMGVKQTGLTLGGVTAALTLPTIAVARGWRIALTAAGFASLVGALVALIGLRGHTRPHPSFVSEGPRLGDLSQFLKRPSVIVLLASGLLLSITQASLLAYLVLFSRDTLGFAVVAAGALLALSQAGGTVGRLGWGIVSDRLFGGRRRPGLVISAVLAASMSLVFASGLSLSTPVAGLVAFLAGIGGFGWVGLYLALAAEVGGPRYASLITGLAVSCSWSGVLVGPPAFGALLEATGSYRWPWLVLAISGAVVAIALHRLPPMVKR